MSITIAKRLSRLRKLQAILTVSLILLLMASTRALDRPISKVATMVSRCLLIFL
jgi:hypothetical protein